MTSITPFLEAHLRLTVNTAKSAVDLPWRRAFMAKLSPLLKRSHEQSLTTTIRKLNPVLRSWVKYYRMTASKRPFEARNGWLRRRLRLILWLHWKRARTRRPRDLMRLNLTEPRAWMSATNGRGPWWNSGAPHMNLALPKKVFNGLSLVSLLM
ncbi:MULTISPECIES: group II intron maturase-specific domain-containing protein [Marinobacter]|jgi:RNA-directed DNA polymerase|uniref:group II intron maturase-specific domain-containing protein n=2 Tax=Marinobacteraceae TaxID=2887365 RepID=UPI001BCB68EC|nr:group II intron maturase-specific domain-containing protein [Marinobacter salarius]MBS8232584.1 hypothetical protein [Marinobacter salarius]WOI17948.1 group II intron maturase-specific domain-containing protein [Marinobacter salarius]